jgi:ubiquitin carboxyl-terminal hydrolase 7
VDVLVPKVGTVDELVAALAKKLEIDSDTEELIRIFEVNNNKIFKELSREMPVANLSDYCSLIAERIPDEETDAEPNQFMYAFHFQGEPNKSHGIPFKFLIKPVSRPICNLNPPTQAYRELERTLCRDKAEVGEAYWH